MRTTALLCILLKCYKMQDNSDTSGDAKETRLETLGELATCPVGFFSQVKGPPMHQHLSLRIRDFEGISSLTQVTKPSRSMTKRGTYGAIFLASLILS